MGLTVDSTKTALNGKWTEVLLSGALEGRAPIEASFASPMPIVGGSAFFLSQGDAPGARTIKASIRCSDYSRTTLTGTHTGSSGSATLSGTGFGAVDSLEGMTVTNTDDGSSALITANTPIAVTGVLAGGTENDWDNGEAYIIQDLVNNENDDFNSIHHSISTTNSAPNKRWWGPFFNNEGSSEHDADPEIIGLALRKIDALDEQFPSQGVPGAPAGNYTLSMVSEETDSAGVLTIGIYMLHPS